jgi:hypothetical protein
MILDGEEARRRAINVRMRIHDAYAQCEPIDTINNLKMERRRIWDEIEVMENDNLGIDDAYGDDQKGHIAKGIFDACLEGMFVTGEEYAAGVKGTGADVELDLFDNLPGLSEYDGENESTPAVVQPVPKGEAAGANEWFLPSGEKICLKLGPVNRGSRRRIGASDQHTVRTAVCSPRFK